MHTPVLFEHPLNEKMRTWLRIEFLIQQMAFHPMIASHADALHFFRNAGDLLDVLERGEVRTDLVKELERQQRKLQSWAEVPGVDQERINALRQQLKQSSSTLMAAPRIGQFLREDRLIALVRQRLSIPGGCCSFDLPTLHIWLHMPQAHRDEQVASWLASLDPLVQSLSLILDLIRNSGCFANRPASTAFIRIMAKMPICCACVSIWPTSFIRRSPAIRAVSPSVSCRWTVSMGSCRSALILNWPAVKEITCQKRLSSTARPAAKTWCGASRAPIVHSAANAAS
jgi:cell division protein ZapD